MKRIFPLILFSFLCLVLASSYPNDKATSRRGTHALASMWKDYEVAAEAGLPQSMMEISAEIKKEAFRRRLPWDFYDASLKHVDAGVNRNWKLRDSLNTAAAKDFEDFGDPLLLLMYDMNMWKSSPDSLYNYVHRHASRLKRSRTASVYSGCNPFSLSVALSSILGPCSESVLNSVDNDYEFALWSLLLRKWDRGKVAARTIDALKASFGNSYPSAAYLELFEIDVVKDGCKRLEMLEEFAEKYSDKAVSLIAWQDLLQHEFDGMEDKASSDEYLAFKEVLNGFQKCRSAFRGDEADIARGCTKVDRILRQMELKSVKAEFRDGRAEFCLRNMDRIRVTVRNDEESVHDGWLYNARRSFYAYDTLRLDLPPMDDGSWKVVCSNGKKDVAEFIYDKYTLSVAHHDVKSDGGNMKYVYVADYKTGCPLESVDMELLTSSGRSLCKVDNVVLEGFTPVPDKIYGVLDQSRYDSHRLLISHRSADGITRRSRAVYLPGPRRAGEDNKIRLGAEVMTDRGAYNPGDTLQYKVVVYVRGAGMRAADEGLDVKVVLRDSRGEKIAEQTLVLNTFGSVAGRFVLDGIERNGYHSLEVSRDGAALGSRGVVVDEFVLPTYDLQFDRFDRIYLPGDKVTLTGVLKSFSGHSLSSADVKYVVKINQELYHEGRLEIASDGRFEIPFTATCPEDRTICDVEVRVMVTDATGETKEFFWSSVIPSWFNVSAQLLDKDEGFYWWPSGSDRDTIYDKNIVGDDYVRIVCAMGMDRKSPVSGLPMYYRLLKGKELVLSGSVMSGDTLSVDFTTLPSGAYEFALEASLKDGYGKTVSEVWRSEILKVGDNDDMLPEPLDRFFRVLDDDRVRFQIGSAVKPMWTVVELVDETGTPCVDRWGKEEVRVIAVNSGSGSGSTLHVVDFDYLESYPEMVTVRVTGFRNSQAITWNRSWKRPVTVPDFNLSISRMQDKVYPDSYCRVDVRMSPDAELLAAVFDKSSETVMNNRWYGIFPMVKPVPYVSHVAGVDAGHYSPHRLMYKSASRNNAVDYVSVEEASSDMSAMGFSDTPARIDIRDDFSATLAFEPFLYPSESGDARLNFRTSDKLSTFVVQMFAHDKNMNNTVVRRDMLVTLPAKVSVAAPSYLYKGDGYVLNASVSNLSDSPLNGVVTVEVYDGDTYTDAIPVQVLSRNVRVPAGGSTAAGFEIEVPDSLGLKVVFAGCMESDGSVVEVSDGVFVTVPVRPDSQTLAESHSMVIRPWDSIQEIRSMLGERFVNVSSAGAEYAEVSLMDMLRKSLPSVVEPEYMDLISLSEAMYADFMAYRLHKMDDKDHEELKPYLEAAMTYLNKMSSYRNADGGFGWLRGMPSSETVTAVVLEHLAALRDKRLLDDIHLFYGEDALDVYDDMATDAVKYLDRSFFRKDHGRKRIGCLSLLQYMYVRTRFAAVPFDVKEPAKLSWDADVEGGSLLDKVRLIRIYMALNASDAGKELARSWGLRNMARLKKQMRGEVESLIEYAVPHPDGGWYYPNAVPSVRGLLESEAYAHAMICDLLRELGEDSLADGICVWIMLQKETQQWSNDPGYLAALSSVYESSDAVKDTRVAKMSKRYQKPFSRIKAVGNGMKMDIGYFKEDVRGNRKEVLPGDTLSVGDKVIAVYSLWSQENRSFVRVSVPRPAALSPADQLSGMIGGWARGSSGVYPYCYREVRSDRTIYWVDVFPEEKSSFEEEMFVMQEGKFVTPSAEMECMYSPHYRANSDGGRIFTVTKAVE